MTTNAFVADCERSGNLPIERIAGGALDFSGLFHALVGHTGFPEDAEQILYPGILFLLLACLALLVFFQKKVKAEPRDFITQGVCGESESEVVCFRLNQTRVLAALFVIVVALLACWRPLVPLFHAGVPFYARFHDPRRILFLVYLFLIFLSGMGFQLIWSNAHIFPRRLVFLRSLLLLFAVAAVCDLLGFSLRRVDWKMKAADEIFPPNLSQSTGISPGERFFAIDRGIQYSYNYTRDRFGESLMPEVGAFYGMEDIQGYDPLIPWRYATYMRRLNAVPFPTPTLYPSHFGLVRSPDSPWLTRFGNLKVRGPIDYEWPFFPPRWVRPGEQLELNLTTPYIPGHILKFASPEVYSATVKTNDFAPAE